MIYDVALNYGGAFLIGWYCNLEYMAPSTDKHDHRY